MNKEMLTIFMQSWLNYYFDLVDWQITLLEYTSILRKEMR